LKRERPDDNRPVHHSQSPRYDQQLYHAKNPKSYDTSRLPPGKGFFPISMVHLLLVIISIVI